MPRKEFRFIEEAIRDFRRDKALFKAIREALSLADRVGSSKCRELLCRALQEA